MTTRTPRRKHQETTNMIFPSTGGFKTAAQNFPPPTVCMIVSKSWSMYCNLQGVRLFGVSSNAGHNWVRKPDRVPRVCQNPAFRERNPLTTFQKLTSRASGPVYDSLHQILSLIHMAVHSCVCTTNRGLNFGLQLFFR